MIRLGEIRTAGYLTTGLHRALALGSSVVSPRTPIRREMALAFMANLESGGGTRPVAATIGAPTLREIHEAGIEEHIKGIPALRILARFREFRLLEPAAQIRLEEIWEEANRLALSQRSDGWNDPFLDTRQPLFFDRYVAGGLSPRHIPLAPLHHEIRSRLTTERKAPPETPPSLSPDQWASWVLFLRHTHAFEVGVRRRRPVSSTDISRKFEVLAEKDQDSFRWLLPKVQEVTGPDHPEVYRLAAVLHRTVSTLKGVSVPLVPEEPRAAYFYRVTPARPYNFHEDWIRERDRAVGLLLDDPALAGQIPKRDVTVFRAFLQRMFDDEDAHSLPTAMDRFEPIRQAIVGLAQGNLPSIEFLLHEARCWDRKGRRERILKLTDPLSEAHGFLRRNPSDRPIVGPLLEFYVVNWGKRRPFYRLTGQLTRRRVERITFFGRGRVRLDFKPDYPDVPAEAVRTYADSVSLNFLPNPDNGWGAALFALSLPEIRQGLREFFVALETRLNLPPAGIIQRWGVTDYYMVRAGKRTVADRFLTPNALARLELTAEETEKLLGLLAFLSLRSDLHSFPDSGPYDEVAERVRFWRVLSAVRATPLVQRLRQRNAFEGDYSPFEWGWLARRDKDSLVVIAEEIGIPRDFREDFATWAIASYKSADRRVEVSHPKPRWILPYGNWSAGRLRARTQSLGISVRRATGLSLPAFARLLGIGLAHVHAVEYRGTTSPVSLSAYSRHLERAGKSGTARVLRLMRAALELHYNPVSPDAALREIGRILRYTRALLPGLSIRRLSRALGRAGGEKVSVPEFFYQQCELGLARMPHNLLEVLAQFYVKKGVFTPKEGRSFVQNIEAIHKAIGLKR